MKRILLYTSMMLLFLACSTEDGTDGLNGTNGIDGIDGLDGADGADGADGEPGTANVIYSDWFTLDFPEDIAGTNYTASVEAPDILDEIVNNGLVIIYARIDGPFLVPRQLPYSHFSNLQHYAPSFRASIPSSPTGRVFVTIWSMDGSPIGAPLFDEYRYIIIPGGIPVTSPSSKTKVLDYTKMTYQEIISHFNIPE